MFSGTHIVEDLQFVVGQQQSNPNKVDALSNPQATICKITRTQHMPPNFTVIHEWFTYAMTSSATDPKGWLHNSAYDSVCPKTWFNLVWSF